MASGWQRTEVTGIYRRLNVATGWLYARFMVRKKPKWVCLPTKDVRHAVTLRNKLIRALKEQPFVDLDRLLKGEAATKKETTIGEIIARYKELAAVPSAGQNVHALRFVLRTAGIPDPDEAPASALSTDTLAAFKRIVERNAAKLNPLKRARTLRSASSQLRKARAVFAAHLRPAYRALDVEIETGFFEIQVDAPAKVYEIPPRQLLEAIAARFPELERQDPAQYAAFLVGIGLGLRNGEAAQSRFDWIEEEETARLVNGKAVLAIKRWLRLTTTAEFTTKTSRPRFVEVPEKVWEGLERVRGAKVPASGRNNGEQEITWMPGDPDFLIPGTSHTDRYNAMTRRLAGWLRRQGLDAARWPKAYYELRKLYGSIIAKRERSILAAAEALGNQPTTAERYYVAALRGPAAFDVLGNDPDADSECKPSGIQPAEPVIPTQSQPESETVPA